MKLIEKIQDFVIESILGMIDILEQTVLPIVNKYILSNYTISSLIFFLLIVWIFKKNSKGVKGRKRR